MRIEVNGAAVEVAATTVAAALAELGYGGAVATALNGDFVPAAARDAAALVEGDRLEVLAPMQGG
jgi:sulfur carrier protein